MNITDNQKQLQTFFCGDTTVTFDNDGYIVKANGFTFIMWSPINQEENLIGMHITELAKMLKKYAVSKENYINFLENVVLKFYEPDNNKLTKKEEKTKKLLKTNY